MYAAEVVSSRLSASANDKAEAEIARARMASCAERVCDLAGFKAAMEALDAAKAILIQSRPSEAAKAGWIR